MALFSIDKHWESNWKVIYMPKRQTCWKRENRNTKTKREEEEKEKKKKEKASTKMTTMASYLLSLPLSESSPTSSSPIWRELLFLLQIASVVLFGLFRSVYLSYKREEEDDDAEEEEASTAALITLLNNAFLLLCAWQIDKTTEREKPSIM